MIELNKFLCQEAMDFLKSLPDGFADLCLTDPPYGIGEAAGKNKTRCNRAAPKDYGNLGWDSEIPSPEYFREIKRVSKNQIIWGGNYFADYLGNSSCWIVWDKDNGLCDFADCELAWTSFKSAVRKFKFRWNGMLQENMVNKEKRYHPTQKPVKLFQWCLEKYSKEGDIIIDPYCGSGTTGIACYNTGRKFLCCDKEQQYINFSMERYSSLPKRIKDFLKVLA